MTDPIEGRRQIVADRHHLTQLLGTLIRVPSVVGAEAAFMRALERELVLLGATVRQYEGVLEAAGSDPESLIVSVHVDRHGIVCTGPDEYQYAAFVAKEQGDLDGNSVSEQTVTTITVRFRGAVVEAYDPWHGGYVGQGHVVGAEYCKRRGNIVFTVDGVGPVRPGTPLAYLQPLLVETDAIAGQLDNALGVAIVVDMFRRGFKGTALFSAEEEAGRSWRYVLKWFRRRDRATRRLLVIDTSPYPDEALASEQDLVLRRRDANGNFDGDFVDYLSNVCRDCNARTTFKDKQIDDMNRQRAHQGDRPRSLGRTELGRLVAGSGGSVTGATLQLPTVGYHTPRERVSLASLDASIRVTNALIAGAAGGVP